MIVNTLPIFVTEAVSFSLEVPPTWSVPPLAAAAVLLLLRPKGRAIPFLTQLLLSAGAAISVLALLQLVPAGVGALLAMLGVVSLVVDELLVQLPALTRSFSQWARNPVSPPAE
jgi:hypothetical protein